jgi:hypothetical protein
MIAGVLGAAFGAAGTIAVRRRRVSAMVMAVVVLILAVLAAILWDGSAGSVGAYTAIGIGLATVVTHGVIDRREMSAEHAG